MLKTVKLDETIEAGELYVFWFDMKPGGNVYWDAVRTYVFEKVLDKDLPPGVEVETITYPTAERPQIGFWVRIVDPDRTEMQLASLKQVFTGVLIVAVGALVAFSFDRVEKVVNSPGGQAAAVGLGAAGIAALIAIGALYLGGLKKG